MKTLAYLLAFALLPAAAGAEEVWRWKDSAGTIHYSNRQELAPADAKPVTTGIVVETSRIPGSEPDLVLRDGMVIDAHDARPEATVPQRRPRRIYTEERLRFGCYAADVLFAGGWSHPDDITLVGNCLPYLLGPEAWLNAARAELGLRENGLDARQVVAMYLAERRAMAAQRLSAASESD